MKDDIYTQQAKNALGSGIPAEELFTPISKATNERVVMRISKSDQAKLTRGPGFKGTIEDKLSGKRFRVFGRACTIPNCFCDAEVENV